MISIGHPALPRAECDPQIITTCEDLWEYLAQVAQDFREKRRRYDEAAEAARLASRAEQYEIAVAVDGLDLGIDL